MRNIVAIGLLLTAALGTGEDTRASMGSFATGAASPNRDIAAARAVFDANIAAIRARDRAKYLSLYLNSELLIRTSENGLVTGFAEFAKGAGSRWPDTIEASDIRLTQLQ